MLMTIAAVSRPTRAAWVGEVRSTLALGWPMMLTNLAQTAHDGHRRADDRPARAGRAGGGALGANLYFLLR